MGQSKTHTKLPYAVRTHGDLPEDEAYAFDVVSYAEGILDIGPVIVAVVADFQDGEIQKDITAEGRASLRADAELLVIACNSHGPADNYPPFDLPLRFDDASTREGADCFYVFDPNDRTVARFTTREGAKWFTAMVNGHSLEAQGIFPEGEDDDPRQDETNAARIHRVLTAEYAGEDIENVISFALADLQHLCEREQLDFSALNAEADNLYWKDKETSKSGAAAGKS